VAYPSLTVFADERPHLFWLVINCNEHTKNKTENHLGIRKPLKYKDIIYLGVSLEVEIGNLHLREGRIHLT